MKPLRLEFSGINSFSEHTIIDFEALTKGGLFGIFGDTGSGKSTILDCINFALFGDVERSKGKTDIINYRSDAAQVKFVFDILSDGKRKTYTVERIIKKDKNGTHKAMLYERDGGEEVCIADKASAVEKKIVEILGVDAEDFRKCIALPQGEFSQFVKSVPSERLALIERLFNLSRYGDRLKEKISARQAAADGEFQLITGKMTAYEDVTEENLLKAQKDIKDACIELKRLKKTLKTQTDEYDGLKTLSEKRAELQTAKQTLEKLESARPQMEELRRDLAALPKCREVAATLSELAKKQTDLQKFQSDILDIEKRAQLESAKIADTERELSSTDFDGETDRLTKLSAAYETCSGKPEKLKELSQKLEKKRSEFRAEETALAELDKKRIRLEKSVADAEEALNGSDYGKTEQLLNFNLKGAVLRGEYADLLGYFVRFRGDIRVFEDDSVFYSFVSGNLDEQIKIYKQKLADLKDVGTEDLTVRLKALQTAREKREGLISDLNAKKQELTSALAEIQVKRAELKRTQDEGADLRARADEIKGELNKVFGGDVTDYSARTEQNARALKDLKYRKNILSDKLRIAQNCLSDLNGELKKLEALKNSACEEIEKLGQRAERDAELSGMGSKEKCIALAAEFGDLPDARQSLENYDKTVAANTERINTLSLVEGIDGATREAVKAAHDTLSLTQTSAEALSGRIAVMERGAETLKENLAKKAELKKQLDVCAKERNLIFQLKEVIRGNKFLEFIANEYLCDISSLASSTLLKLTDGRYFLAYKDNNFNVGDNFDCGNLRGVNTLSGGETFLVSLSLALALSQTICSKSRKNIEFFFLDEGFGTLDSTLVDTVMSALEKLKSADFTIGVISHVEELKHRIDNKITIIKATESHGSTVRLSC